MPVHESKTSITDIIVANERLIRETAALTKEDSRKVKAQIQFLGRFIADTMAKGEMQSVMIPNFGKFKPKAKLIKAYKDTAVRRSNCASDDNLMNMYRAIKGLEVYERKNGTYKEPENKEEEL